MFLAKNARYPNGFKNSKGFLTTFSKRSYLFAPNLLSTRLLLHEQALGALREDLQTTRTGCTAAPTVKLQAEL